MAWMRSYSVLARKIPSAATFLEMLRYASKPMLAIGDNSGFYLLQVGSSSSQTSMFDAVDSGRMSL